MSFPGEPWVSPPLACADEIDPSVDQDEIAAVVSELLFVLSGRQFGIVTSTLRPRTVGGSCARRRAGCFDVSPCGGSTVTIEDLPSPITDVSEVRVDGVVLPEEAYEWSASRIRRLDGEAFPCCQDVSLPFDAVGTLSIAMSWGKAIPESGLAAAREFACQMALGAAPSTAGKCKLPARVQTITRQGVTMAMLDPQQFLDDGRTGLYLVDLFLVAFNPGKNRQRARVFSPDVPTITQ